MIITTLQVAAGGAIGASMRYLSGVYIFRLTGHGASLGGFPLGVITVNIVGSFLMGAFVVIAAQRGLTYLGPFVMTGLLGGFTTFSAFSQEAYSMFERGQTSFAAFYVLASVSLSILGLVAGMLAARALFA